MENEQLYESLKDLVLQGQADLNTRLENLEGETKQLKLEAPHRKADYLAQTGQLRPVTRGMTPMPRFDGRYSILTSSSSRS